MSKESSLIWASSQTTLTSTTLPKRVANRLFYTVCVALKMVLSWYQIKRGSSACMGQTLLEFWRQICLGHTLTFSTVVWTLVCWNNCPKISILTKNVCKPLNMTLTFSRRSRGHLGLNFTTQVAKFATNLRTFSQNSITQEDATLLTSSVELQKPQLGTSSWWSHQTMRKTRSST